MNNECFAFRLANDSQLIHELTLSLV